MVNKTSEASSLQPSSSLLTSVALIHSMMIMRVWENCSRFWLCKNQSGLSRERKHIPWLEQVFCTAMDSSCHYHTPHHTPHRHWCRSIVEVFYEDSTQRKSFMLQPFSPLFMIISLNSMWLSHQHKTHRDTKERVIHGNFKEKNLW